MFSLNDKAIYNQKSGLKWVNNKGMCYEDPFLRYDLDETS